MYFFFQISIHPPLAGRDKLSSGFEFHLDEFQSTRPLRDGTTIIGEGWAEIRISIHPPLAGRDKSPHRTDG